MNYFTLSKKDLFIAFMIFMAGLLGSFYGNKQINPAGVTKGNVWFQADIGRVYGNMTNRYSNHYRTKVHPLFSLVSNPVIHIINHVTGIKKNKLVRGYISTATGAWLVLLFVVLRLLRLRRLDSVLFSLLAAASASAFFWCTVPETFLLGSITMLLVMGFVIISNNRYFHPAWYVCISAVSMSMTVTNWMAGILATKVNQTCKQTFKITLNAFVLVTVLWAIQHTIYPSAEFFILFQEERHYLMREHAGGILEKTAVFFIHSMVMPAIQVMENPYAAHWPFLTIQFSAIGSTGVLGYVMTVIWAGLLGFGVWSAYSIAGNTKFKIVLFLIIAGQLCLHLIYGDETFLYSLHWLPFLILLAALGTSSIYRRYVLAAVIILIVGAGINNFQQFKLATSELNSEKYGTKDQEREKLLYNIEAYPDADWPRSEGHVLLAKTGSPLNTKGYHEPGGNFSPGFGSFGISFVFFNDEGELEFSSNTISKEDVTQKLNIERNSILTLAPDYSAEWRVAGEAEWSLQFMQESSSNMTAAIRISSSGPSGSPINQFHWDGNNLTVNDKYSLEFSPPPARVLFSDEKEKPRLPKSEFKEVFEPSHGYGSAMFILESGQEHQIKVTNTTKQKVNTNYWQSQNYPEINFPDERFRESLLAQIFHIKAGIVNGETRPGDPGNYDINWLRDGAYTIVALARIGELQLAKYLSNEFAIHDFFGGFGSEADAPGLAIWALDEISVRLNDQEYDKWIWPHVLRKVDLIFEMLEAKQEVHKVFYGPVVPGVRHKKYKELTLIADPANNGLITGRMDGHRPVFYVNAIAYLGLVRASMIADRLGHHDKAENLGKRALKLKADWEKALNNHPDKKNTRTLISGLWPTEIASDKKDLFENLLQEDWGRQRTNNGDFVSRPEWTYFEVAKAHQWLMLERPGHVWSTLEWFWRHQVSPGLYTWWEGSGEENSFHLWETVRGWYKPRHVTPHYWAAAEMALLQLDMLAYEMIEQDEATIVIGAGIPSSWLNGPLSVSGISLHSGNLSWKWDGKYLTVEWDGKNTVEFVIGTSFPPQTILNVQMINTKSYP